MSFNDAEIDNKVMEGLFPATSKAYILAPGSIHNTHYVGIPSASSNKEAAMVVCNFLISPEAQVAKNDIRLWAVARCWQKINWSNNGRMLLLPCLRANTA